MTAGIARGIRQADGSMKAEPVMELEPVVRALVLMALLPPDVNVLSMTMLATGMPFVGRG